MNKSLKVQPHHLERGAYLYIRQFTGILSTLASSLALRTSGGCRHRVRCSSSLTPACSRMRCTVMGSTLSTQFGDRCPSPVNIDAISSSCSLARASSNTRSVISAPLARCVIAETRIFTSSSVSAPPRQTMRTRLTSCSLRSRTTLSTRQRDLLEIKKEIDGEVQVAQEQRN